MKTIKEFENFVVKKDENKKKKIGISIAVAITIWCIISFVSCYIADPILFNQIMTGSAWTLGVTWVIYGIWKF